VGCSDWVKLYKRCTKWEKKWYGYKIFACFKHLRRLLLVIHDFCCQFQLTIPVNVEWKVKMTVLSLKEKKETKNYYFMICVSAGGARFRRNLVKT
jgi:hypothetical protein